MPMTLRRPPTAPFRHALQGAAMLHAVALTAACSSLAQTTTTTALSADYRVTIAKHMKTLFKDVVGGAEISDPRWVQSNKGWGWTVCVHFPDRGHQRTYVFVFNGDEFIDERYAVQTDSCAAQTYSAFDLGAGTRPGAIGDPGPLY
jgi:hypothetical protein